MVWTTVAALAPAAAGWGQAPLSADSAREICITLDDLPVVRVHDPGKRLHITENLLAALDTFGVPATGFVVGHNMMPDERLLSRWLRSGHTLGNHTYNHPDINDLPLELYLQDIDKGRDVIEQLLIDAGQPRRYFRPPLLHYGASAAVKDSLMAYLAAQGYLLAHVTVDNDDYLYNVKYEKLIAGPDSTDLPRLGREFIEHIRTQLDSAETLAQKIAGRPVRQILLLHANQLNGRFLPDLLTMIRGKGYRFITLDSALADPVFARPDPYVGPKGISFLERLATAAPSGPRKDPQESGP